MIRKRAKPLPTPSFFIARRETPDGGFFGTRKMNNESLYPRSETLKKLLKERGEKELDGTYVRTVERFKINCYYLGRCLTFFHRCCSCSSEPYVYNE